MRVHRDRVATQQRTKSAALAAFQLALLALVMLTPACLVTHTARSVSSEPGDETLLKRASEALLGRIQIEKEHVDFYNRELIRLRAEERRLSAEFVLKEAEYQLLASDRDGQIQEAAEARGEYQAALNSKAQLDAQLVGVREQAAALVQERAELEASITENQVATEEGRVRLLADTAKLAEVTAREAVLSEELSERRRAVEAQNAEFLAVQAELEHLQRTLRESSGARQWLRSSLMVALFSSSLQQQAEGASEAGFGEDSLAQEPSEIESAAEEGRPAATSGGGPEQPL